MINRRVILFFALFILSVPLAWASPDKAAASAEMFQPSNQALFKQVRTALDFIDETMAASEVKLSDMRLSPVIRSEQWFEYPMECGFLCEDLQLAPLLKKLLGFSFADGKMGFGAICVAVTAESKPEGVPLLSVNLNTKYYVGKLDSHPEFPATRNAVVVNAFARLFKLTTMTPQIRRRVEQSDNQLRGGKTWLTNLRVDSDHRVQMTGYALDAKQVTAFAEELYSCGSFDEVFICSYNRNTYEKVPVFRFDIVARLK